ncbi:MAG: hypothetical protein WA624_13890 [Methylocella sp.]
MIISASHAEAAGAASLNVKIRQLNPDGQAQQVTCGVNAKCPLSLDIQTGSTKETLTVDISFVPGNVLFTFETPKGFLYGGEKTPADPPHAIYETVWHRGVVEGTPSTSNVTLFGPPVPKAFSAPMLSTVPQPVADLEVTLVQAP